VTWKDEIALKRTMQVLSTVTLPVRVSMLMSKGRETHWELLLIQDKRSSWWKISAQVLRKICTRTCMRSWKETLKRNSNRKKRNQTEQLTKRSLRDLLRSTNWSKEDMFSNIISHSWCFRRRDAFNTPFGGDLFWHGYIWQHRERHENQDWGPTESHWRHHGATHRLFRDQRIWVCFLLV